MRFSFLRFLCATLLTLSFTTSTSAQKTDAVWDLLFKNERKQALKLSEKLTSDNTMESLLINAIVRVENGMMIPEEDFIDRFIEKPEFENYLFAHWFSTFLLGDYLETGYDPYNSSIGKKIEEKNIENTTVKNGLAYFTSIAARHRKDWDAYVSGLANINAITDWEYCGVFENLNNSGMATIYAPEENPNRAVPFETEGNGTVSWYVKPATDEVYNFFTNHTEYGAGVNYAQTFITSDTDKRVYLKVGHGGLLKVYVNDVLVVNRDKDIITEMDAVTYAVNLKKGANRILVKSATEIQTAYFILRLEDENGLKVPGLSIDLSARNYQSSSQDDVNPIFVPHKVINYFENKRKEGTEDFLTDYSLFFAYLRNSDNDAAMKVVDLWLEKYPKSSLLLAMQAECFNRKGDETRGKEIVKNIEINDPKYYLSALSVLENLDQIMSLDVEAFNSRLEEIAEAVDYSYIRKAMDLFKTFRTRDMQDLRVSLDTLLDDPYLPSSIQSLFIQFYDQLLNDEDKTIERLEEITNTTYNYEAVSLLRQYYSKQNRVEESKSIYAETLDKFSYDNNTLYEYINLLQSNNEYEASIPYIEQAIQNFPDTYTFLEFMGQALQQIGKKKEALAYYEKASVRNGADLALRKLILDLNGDKDPLEQFKVKDLYKVVEEERGKITTNNNGLNILLDQIDVLKYEQSGGRYHGTYIYEVTSQQGVDALKEYNLGLYGDYTIFKSEIVRPDKSIVPAECSGSNCVFNGLSVGDVILFDFENSFSKSGRFYKNYQDSKSFSNYNPVVQKIYRVLIDKSDDPLLYKTANGNLIPKEYTKGDYRVYEWTQENEEPLKPYESYMPVYEDTGKELHVSTIKSWSEISDWYSDLVRNQIIYDDTVDKAFNEIFPEGYKDVSQDERAKRIYKYITSSFSYSYVSFKQSGFVPQKPSKVISTKLGDCKDFSTLFLTLAKQAELEANLVLILTSDNGERALMVPGTDFNHCIIRVKIDGKQQYLELTSKYLPYKALPVSLINATALEIPFTKGEMPNNELKTLVNLDRKQALFKSEASIKIGLDNSAIDLTTTTTGSLSSSYIKKLEENKTEETLKKAFSDEVKNRNERDLTFLSLDGSDYSKDTDVTSFSASLRWNEKPNKIGSLRTVEVPYFANPYNQSIIDLEERNYPIRYIKYENADRYEEKIVLELDPDLAFTEVPENQNFSFKNHSYNVSYTKNKENILEVAVSSVTPLDDIAPEDYLAFRVYVQDVLESRRQLIGFK